MMVSIAVTATVHDPGDFFEDWCTYHRNRFDLVLVWIDEPHQLSRVQHLQGDGLEIAIGTQLTHDSRLTQTLLRQDANADRAMGECLRRRISWLLHIDSDELFIPLDSRLWEEEPSVAQLIFVNHEACPQWTAENPFRQIRHFRRNGRLPFRLYQGGKAAVRCAPGVRADGPHRFAGRVGASRVSKDAFLLHYACYSFANWLEKYLHLGAFSDWYRDDFRSPIGLEFHLESRNLVQEYLVTGDLGACRSFFSQAVWDEETLERLASSGEVLVVSPEKLLGPPRRLTKRRGSA